MSHEPSMDEKRKSGEVVAEMQRQKAEQFERNAAQQGISADMEKFVQGTNTGSHKRSLNRDK